MVSNEEIKLRLALKREGKYSEEWIKDQSKIQVPSEWVDNACIFDFGPILIKDLSIIIKDFFENEGYHLEEGSPINGIYGRGHSSLRLLVGYFAFRYRFKVEIYSDSGSTSLKVYKAMTGIMEGIIDGWQGLALYNKEFYRLIDTIKHLKPIYKGYLICNKCGGYYKLQPEESPEDFTDKCECGGSLKYVEEIDFEKNNN